MGLRDEPDGIYALVSIFALFRDPSRTLRLSTVASILLAAVRPDSGHERSCLHDDTSPENMTMLKLFWGVPRSRWKGARAGSALSTLSWRTTVTYDSVSVDRWVNGSQ